MKNFLLRPFPIIVSLILIFVVLAFMMDKCQCKKPKVVPVSVKEQEKTVALEKEFKRYKDSTDNLVSGLIKSKDSALLIAQQAKKKSSYTLRKAGELAVRQDLAKQNFDSAQYIAVSDSLGDVVEQLQIEKKQQDESYSATIEYYDAIVYEMQGQILERDTLISELKKSQEIVTRENIKISDQLNKANKKNSRQWVLGPSVSFGIGPNGQLTPVVGVSLVRQLFKFKF